MKIDDFSVGLSYSARKLDFVPPDGSPVVQGKIVRFTVLAPADASNTTVYDGLRECKPSQAELDGYAQFLRVHNIDSRRTHFLHPVWIESAEQISL
jgi:hypothetical protein